MDDFILMLSGVVLFTTSFIFAKQFLINKNPLFLAAALILYNSDFLILLLMRSRKNNIIFYILRSIFILILSFAASAFLFETSISPAQYIGIVLAATATIFLSLSS